MPEEDLVILGYCHDDVWKVSLFRFIQVMMKYFKVLNRILVSRNMVLKKLVVLEMKIP